MGVATCPALAPFPPGASPVAPVVKNPPANAKDMRHEFDPWVGKIPGEGNGNPLQYLLYFLVCKMRRLNWVVCVLSRFSCV